MKRMEKVVLQATHRTITGKKVGTLRRQGKLPAVIYGHHTETMPIILNLHDASRILSHLTSSSLVTINVDGKEYATLVREKQRNFITNTLLHVDFQAVSLTEKIRANVSVVLTGTAPAVKDFNGVVVVGLDEIEVESLPQYLPERIVVDIANLNKIGDAIYVRDLQVSADVEILDDLNETIVIITAQAAEEIEEAPVAAEIAEPEVIEKGKKEEEVPE